MAYMEPRALPYEEFPEEKETRPGVRTLTMDKNAYGTEHFPDVTYAVRDGAARATRWWCSCRARPGESRRSSSI